MVEKSKTKNPDVQIKCGDVNQSMVYEPGSFTHILCLGFTIYQFPDKRRFFQNCYTWLKPGGYLVIHLVDRDRFDTIIPAGKPPLVDSPQKHVAQRITDTVIDFIDFQYKSAFQFNDKEKTAVLKETFTDGMTKNVRQNELVLYMENVDEILRISSRSGFLVKSQVNMLEAVGDDYQYIVILERSQ
jgi:SAM-dependent methyltransferase